MYIAGTMYELGSIIRYCERTRLNGNCEYCPFIDFLNRPTEPNKCLAPLEDLLVFEEPSEEVQ